MVSGGEVVQAIVTSAIPILRLLWISSDVIQGAFLTGPSKIFQVSDYIVNPIKKVPSVRIYLLTGT